MSPGDPHDLIRSAMSASYQAKPRKAFGYSFLSKQKIRTMHGKLNANTRWVWAVRVSDTHGEYLVSRPMQNQDYARVRIFSLPSDRFHLDVVCVGTCAADDTWKTLDKEIIYAVLPQISAFDVAEASYFD